MGSDAEGSGLLHEGLGSELKVQVPSQNEHEYLATFSQVSADYIYPDVSSREWDSRNVVVAEGFATGILPPNMRVNERR